MAARRLLIILVLLLAASVVAASLAPDRTGPLSGDESTTSTSTSSTAPTTSTATQEPSSTDAGESLRVRIDASAENPETVEGFTGDQLALDVGSKQPRTIAIEPLGLTEFAEPDAPAHFDLLLRDVGTIPITDLEGGEVVGRLVVAEPGEPRPEPGPRPGQHRTKKK